MRHAEFHAALRHLLDIAAEHHADARAVSGFLMAWWDGERLGGIQISHLWRLDDEVREAILTVFAHVLRKPSWPNQFGFDEDFKCLEARWTRRGRA